MLVAASVPASPGNVVAWVCFGLCYSLYLLNKAARWTLYIRVYVFENVLAPGCLLLRLDLFFSLPLILHLSLPSFSVSLVRLLHHLIARLLRSLSGSVLGFKAGPRSAGSLSGTETLNPSFCVSSA